MLVAAAFMTLLPPNPELRLSEVLADVEAHAPALLADRARARALSRAADATGFWDEPFIAAGPDELALSGEPMPVIRYQMSQRVPFPGKLDGRATAARARAEAQAQNFAVTARTLRVAAVQLFLRALYLDEVQRTNDELAQTLHDAKASAEARYITGGTAHHDALLADAQLAILARDQRILERARRILLIRLHELCGRPSEPRPMPSLIDDTMYSLPKSIEDALAAQPELARVRKNVEALRGDARVAGLQAFPDLTVQVMAMQSLHENEPSNVGAMVGLAVPIFLPWKQDAVKDAAEQHVRAAETEVDALVLRLRAEWDAATEDLASARDTFELYEQQILPRTRLALDASQSAYATQQVALLEVLSVARAFVQAKLEAKAASLDVRLAMLRLTELSPSPSVLRLAPGSPTLFGGMAPGGMTTMGGAAGAMGGMGPPGSMPVRMGESMSPGLIGGDGAAGGMEGM